VSSTISNYAAKPSGSKDDDFGTNLQHVAEIGALYANLTGYFVENQEVVVEGKQYRAFVMLRYPLAEIDKIVANYRKGRDIEASKRR